MRVGKRATAHFFFFFFRRYYPTSITGKVKLKLRSLPAVRSSDAIFRQRDTRMRATDISCRLLNHNIESPRAIRQTHTGGTDSGYVTVKQVTLSRGNSAARESYFRFPRPFCPLVLRNHSRERIQRKIR